MPSPADIPICPYCQQEAKFFAASEHIYGAGRDFGPVWHCEPCKAWVGCHPDGRALGRLADKPLRAAKTAAHAAFDPFVEAKMRKTGCARNTARRAGYKWLAEQLGLTKDECHIGLMDDAMCRRVIEVCQAARQRKTK